MVANRMNTKSARRKLTNRERIIMLITGLVLLGGLAYRFPYTLQAHSINELKTKVVNAQKDVLAIEVQIVDLKASAADIKSGKKSGIARWDLIDQKGVIMVLEGISSEAKREGVNLISVHPSKEVDKEKYREVTMNLDLKGRYRDLAEYFKHLENLSQIVNVRKIRVEACPDASSACATKLEAVTYMEK